MDDKLLVHMLSACWLIGAYFLAVSSHKRGCLNTSVYGIIDQADSNSVHSSGPFLYSMDLFIHSSGPFFFWRILQSQETPPPPLPATALIVVTNMTELCTLTVTLTLNPTSSMLCSSVYTHMTAVVSGPGPQLLGLYLIVEHFASLQPWSLSSIMAVRIFAHVASISSKCLKMSHFPSTSLSGVWSHSICV